MTLEELRATLPDHARDLKLNLSTVMADPGLTDQQRWGTLLACAIASRQPELRRVAEAEAAARLTPAAVTAARSAAAIMAMNNVYYRFLHLLGDAEYSGLPARLRMNVLANPGVDKIDFELWSIAVSAYFGCGQCIQAHERTLRNGGVGREVVQGAVRIAAVVHGVAVVLDAATPAA